MLAQLVMALVVEAFDGRILDRAVHAFDLAVGPWVPWLCRSVVDIGLGASMFEGVRPYDFSRRHGFLDQRNGRAAGTWGRELNAVVGKHCVDLVRDSIKKMAQEIGGDRCRCLLVQLDESELRGPI